MDEMCFDALLCQKYELSSTCRFMDVAFLEASFSSCEAYVLDIVARFGQHFLWMRFVFGSVAMPDVRALVLVRIYGFSLAIWWSASQRLSHRFIYVLIGMSLFGRRVPCPGGENSRANFKLRSYFNLCGFSSLS